MSSLAQKIKKNKREQRMKKHNESKTNECELDVDNEDESVKMSIKLWNDIKKRVADDNNFIKMDDNDKIGLYQKSEFKVFYTEFPIVSRYMICMGQFSIKAFKRFLLSCKNAVHDPVKSREKGYSEDQWIQRQSDYVRYLWESYQNKPFSKAESDEVWQQTYEILKKEFQDFKDLHKEIENKLKNDEKTNKKELVKELITRLANDKQSLDDDATKNLILNLKEQVMNKRKKLLINDINNNVTTIAPVRETIGDRKELKQSKNSI